MDYLTTFAVGIISFLSPCMLPMLPIYFSYFSQNSNHKGKIFLTSLSFVLGFSVLFCALGLFMGGLGALLSRFHMAVELISGGIVVLLGLNFLGILKLPHRSGSHSHHKVTDLASAFLFGVLFSVSHLPCVGAFLGTALVTAGVSGSVGKGVLLLLAYSAGMGIPFLVSAVLSEKLSPVIENVKKNYRVINLICGILLIVLGVLMATGLLHHMFHGVS